MCDPSSRTNLPWETLPGVNGPQQHSSLGHSGTQTPQLGSSSPLLYFEIFQSFGSSLILHCTLNIYHVLVLKLIGFLHATLFLFWQLLQSQRQAPKNTALPPGITASFIIIRYPLEAEHCLLGGGLQGDFDVSNL